MKLPKKHGMMPFVVLMLILLVLHLVLLLSGLILILQALSLIIAPSLAMLFAIFGTFFFGKEGFVKEDKFHVMFTFTSMSLFIMAITDIAGIAMKLLPNGENFVFIVGILYFISFVTMALGIFRYFHNTLTILGFPSKGLVWIFSLIGPVIIVIIVTLVGPNPFTIISSLEYGASTLFGIGFGIVTIQLIVLVWIFKDGELALPLLLLLIGVLMLFLMGTTWSGFAVDPFDVGIRGLAISAYTFLGASINVARSMNSDELVLE